MACLVKPKTIVVALRPGPPSSLMKKFLYFVWYFISSMEGVMTLRLNSL